jgi:hypothetical protein
MKKGRKREDWCVHAVIMKKGQGGPRTKAQARAVARRHAIPTKRVVETSGAFHFLVTDAKAFRKDTLQPGHQEAGMTSVVGVLKRGRRCGPLRR